MQSCSSTEELADAGGWGQEAKGWQRMKDGWVASQTSMDKSLSELGNGDGQGGATIHGVWVRPKLSDWTELN